jgi:hypothetical protein
MKLLEEVKWTDLETLAEFLDGNKLGYWLDGNKNMAVIVTISPTKGFSETRYCIKKDKNNLIYLEKIA